MVLFRLMASLLEWDNSPVRSSFDILAVGAGTKLWMKPIPAAVDTANFDIHPVVRENVFDGEPPAALLTSIRHGLILSFLNGMCCVEKTKAQGIFRYLGLRPQRPLASSDEVGYVITA